MRHLLLLPLLCAAAPRPAPRPAPPPPPAHSGIDGTWELSRVFRPGPVPSVRAVPLDSTTFLRITFTTQEGGWVTAATERRYLGRPDRARLQGRASGEPGHWLVAYRYLLPTWTRGEAVAWVVGDTLRMGGAIIPGADSIE
ncbi:MAG: hypothetical protein ACREMR_04550, partial [Gemmatimonadales bacterium]